MAQSVSAAAAAPRRAVLPPPKEGEKLEGRIVNDLPPLMKEAFEISALVVEVLSFLPADKVADAALNIVPRQVKHAKLGELYLKSQGREACLPLEQLVDLPAYFGARVPEARKHHAFLPYFCKMEVITVHNQRPHFGFDFIPNDIRTYCPRFKGIEIFRGANVSINAIPLLNRRVPLHFLKYRDPDHFLDDEIAALTELRTLHFLPDFTEIQNCPFSQDLLNIFGRLPHLRGLKTPAMPDRVFIGFPELEKLSLLFCTFEHFESDAFIASLVGLPKLTTLWVDLESDCDIAKLAPLPQLKTLILSGFYGTSPENRESLQLLMGGSSSLQRIIFDQRRLPKGLKECWKKNSKELKGFQEAFPNIALLTHDQTPLFPDLIKLKPAAQAPVKDPSVQALDEEKKE